MDVETDAVPSAPRPLSETEKNEQVPQNIKKNINVESEKPHAAQGMRSHERKNSREAGCERKVENNVHVENSRNVNIVMGNITTINNACKHSQPSKTNVRNSNEVPQNVPTHIQALFTANRELTPDYIAIVSRCLSKKGLSKLSELLEIPKTDVKRAEYNFRKSGGLEEVVSQTLLQWTQDNHHKKNLFSFFCKKLWIVPEKDGGKIALNRLSEAITADP